MLGFKDKSKMKMRFLGDPILAAKAKKIEVIDTEVRELGNAMIDLMRDKNGVGLAGNQIGLPYAIITVEFEHPEDDDGNKLPLSTEGEAFLIPKMPLVLINPEIVSYSEKLSDYEEGCLSMPKLYAKVVRPEKIVLKSKMLDGSEFELECGGFLARVLQHEIDHLNGRVFVEIAEEKDYLKIEPRLRQLIRKSGQKNFKVRRPGAATGAGEK